MTFLKPHGNSAADLDLNLGHFIPGPVLCPTLVKSHQYCSFGGLLIHPTMQSSGSSAKTSPSDRTTSSLRACAHGL